MVGAGRGYRVGSVIGGTLLVALGVPMLVLPGPGIAAILAGGALIARGLRGKERARGKEIVRTRGRG